MIRNDKLCFCFLFQTFENPIFANNGNQQIKYIMFVDSVRSSTSEMELIQEKKYIHPCQSKIKKTSLKRITNVSQFKSAILQNKAFNSSVNHRLQIKKSLSKSSKFAREVKKDFEIRAGSKEL